MDDAERINLFMRHYNLTPTLLAERIGKDRPQVIYDIQKRKQGISKSIAGLICNEFTEVSYAWLLGESGDMLKEFAQEKSPPAASSTDQRTEIEILRCKNEDLIEMVAQLKITQNVLLNKLGLDETGKSQAG